MRKALLCFLVFFMIFPLSGCGGKAPANSPSASGAKQVDNGEYAGLEHYEEGFSLGDYPDFYQDGRVKLYARKDCLTQEQLKSVCAELNRVIDTLEQYLGTTLKAEWDTDTITYFVTPGQISHAVGSFFKPVVMVGLEGRSLSLYIHETTHILAGCHRVNSTWMTEGLAVYLNAKFSTTESWPDYGMGLDALARDAYREGLTRYETEFTYADHAPVTSDGRAYYLLCGSFVGYLLSKMSVGDYMDVYRSPDANAALLAKTRKNLVQWKEEWLRQLGVSNP